MIQSIECDGAGDVFELFIILIKDGSWLAYSIGALF